MQVDINVNPYFQINSTFLLENPQTISNALYIKVASKKNDATISAAIPSGISSSTSTPMPASNIKLCYNHTTCPVAQQKSIQQGDIPMGSSPSVLFQQKKKNKLTAYWYYDIKIPAIGYNYAPGNYNFTIQFTMTQP